MTDGKGLVLHDGRQLPDTGDLRKTLRAGLDAVLAEEYAARGGQQVDKPEDAYPTLRRLGGLAERLRDYGRAFTDTAREVEARAGDDLIEMHGEDDGIPKSGAKVPDLDGTTLEIRPDYVNAYEFDTDALIGAVISALLADESFLKAASDMFQAEFSGDGAASQSGLADLLDRMALSLLELGKFQPQITKVRHLSKVLSGTGADSVASTITDATTKTVHHKGTKISRVHPKGEKE